MSLRYPRAHFIFSDTPAPQSSRDAPPTALRSQQGPATPAVRSRLQAAGLVIDLEQRFATVDGRVLELTYMEFELLAHLVAQPLRVLSRRQLMDTVWGQPAMSDTRTVSTHVARLRRKLGPTHRATIATVRQIGYKFDPRLTDPA